MVFLKQIGVDTAKNAFSVNAFWFTYAILALTHVALCSYQAHWNSPTRNEKSHLVAGLSHLRFQRFDLFRVNPPLIRTVAALPLIVCSPEENWTNYRLVPTERREPEVGDDFAIANGRNFFWLMTLARLACLPFTLLGGWVCGRWAMRVYGIPSSVVAMSLWFFSPMVLGHASLITADAHSAAIGVAAMYGVWNWLNEPTWRTTLSSGFLLGLAELSKYTLLVLYPVIVVLWVAHQLPKFKLGAAYGELLQLAVIFGVSIITINVGYGFEGTFKHLDEYRFKSRLFTGLESPSPAESAGYPGRFADSLIGAVPLPLPANYVQGIDAQRVDLERGIGPSYLCGTWQKQGWWYWYLYAFAFKTPLGTLALLATAVTVTCLCRWANGRWRDELTMLLPAIAIIALLSSQTSFTIHYRYALPALPFLFVWISKSAISFVSNKKAAIAVAGFTIVTAVESLSTFPHCLSFFNWAVGGPGNGHYFLLDSNTAWGQDLFYFDSWRKNHPQAQPCYLFAYYGQTEPGLWDRAFDSMASDNCEIKPGWYAIDVNMLHEYSDDKDDPCAFLSEFLNLEPIARAGYSINIYHITTANANRIRMKRGLPRLWRE